ncbi:MAG: hypothetical protein H6618_09095, partial [Deltaproteobacteria bacterium]|nr:hypothetical protein [Deltaproteobacteria bacterium]
FLIILATISCAHYPDVRPGESEHKVIVFAEDEGKGFKNAINQANDFCDDAMNEKKAVIISEKKEYKGSMDESSYKKSKMTTEILGSITSLGDQYKGASIRNINLGKPYEITLIFRCR